MGSRRHPNDRARAGLLRAKSGAGVGMSVLWSREGGLVADVRPPRTRQRHRVHAAGWPSGRGCGSTATSSCGGGRSRTQRTSGRRSGTTTRSTPRRPRGGPGRTGDARARGGSRAPGSTMPRRCSRVPTRSAASIVHVGEDGVVTELTIGSCAARSERWPPRCASSGSDPATVSPPTCPTCPRRSSPCWRRRASARSGRSAPRTSRSSSVIDRFSQIEPTVLIAVDGYRFNGRRHDRLETIASSRPACPRCARRSSHAVSIPTGRCPTSGRTRLLAGLRPAREPEFATLAFAHPLWILFSSGTTGLPKGIVQSHGGILLEHLKSLGLCMDLRAERPLPVLQLDQLDGLELPGRWPAARHHDRALRRAPAYRGPAALWRVAATHRRHRAGDGLGLCGRLPERRRCRLDDLALERSADGDPDRLAAGPGRLAVAERAARAGGADRLDLRRHRRLHRVLRRQPAAARVARARCRAAGWASAPTPSTRTDTSWSARSASSWSPSRCRRCRSGCGTTRAASATARRTSTRSPASGARATGSRSRHAARSGSSGRSDATLNRGGVRLGSAEIYARGRRADGGRGHAGGRASSSPTAGTGCRCSSSPTPIQTCCATGSRWRSALRCRRATSRRGHRGARDPPHVDRQETRGSGQAHTSGDAIRSSRGHRLRRPPRGACVLCAIRRRAKTRIGPRKELTLCGVVRRP